MNGDPIDDVGVSPSPAPIAPSPTDPVATDPGPTEPVVADPVASPGVYNTVFNVISDWGSGFTGEVAVQNLSSETLKGWEASFDFAGDINSIWNGQIVNQSGSRYTVRGALWNPDVSPGGTVTFGFNGTPGGSQAVLENFAVMGIHDAPQPIAPSPTQPAPLPMPAPTPVADPVDGQGNVFTISPSSPDIVGFNPSTDRLEFGDVSVHNLIIGKTEAGEVAIINPWAWSPEYQVVSGVAYSDLTTENFGVIVNEHLRQDIGGVLSWELGVGPRDANTVYVRSHEYGVQERIEDFDPATTKLSFLYFGTRERLSVDDTDEGLLISVEPTGQSVLLVGVAKSDLVPSNIEFHHDQMVEDQLEVPFGFTVEQLTMVSRSALLTPEAPAGELTDGFQTSPGSVAPHDGHDHDHDHDHGTMPMPTDPVVSDPVVDPVDPVMPPMDDHDGHDGHDDMPMDDHDGHDHMAPPASSGEFIDITTWGTFHDSNNNSHNHELVGGRTAITTEAMDAYNNLRAFLGLSALTIDDVGEWAFAEQLTNNAQPYGNDIKSVGLWYAMQGVKVGWIAQDKYDPQILADIQRTARLGDPADVMTMVREFGISGYADYLEQYGIADTFISTLKMEPHYGGVMHGRTHGYLSIEGVAINHDVNHLTVLSWDQTQPFMNDTFDWPQWPALDVSDAGVMEYYQSMVVLGDPVGLNMESVSAPVAPPVVSDPVTPPMDDHDHGDHDHGTTPAPTDPTDVSYTVVASTTDVSVLVDSSGLAYLSESDGDPIAITRSDDYWQGAVPLTRGGATIMAAARDDLGRLRVLDGGGVDVYAWILSDSGMFVGEDSPSDTTIAAKESLFQLDINGNGMIDHDHGTMPMPTDPVVSDPVVDPVDPVMPPMDDHDGHDGHDDMPMDDHDGHDHMAPPASSGEFIDITTWGTFHDSNNNSHNHELVGGRTAITTEAMDAYNNLRAFLGLSALTIDDVGEWAFAEQLTNNAQPYGNDIKSVGLWYAMQGAKVGWIAQDKYDPQILADIQRTARLGDPADVMMMVREFGISGYADYLEQYGIADTFISTLKMEPHYGGVMHGRTHGYLSIEGVAINHDVNHLTVLSWDQTQPFMNDTFDWPQWPAADVSDAGVMEYYQSMVVLGDPVGLNMESVSAPVAPPVVSDPVVSDPVVSDPVVSDPVVSDPVVSDPVVSDPVVSDPVVTDPSASPIASHDKVLAAYFPEWGIYGRDYQLADVPADELTHLIYAFADLNAAGEMTLFDSYAATEKRFSAEESVTGEADQWYYPPEDPRSEQTIWGNFNQLALLKEANPHLTVSIAVGGWTLSDHFSTVTSTQAGRDAFSDSIVEFLTTYQVFDGIDFDWEYPGGGGEAGNSASPNDGANYALLMADVRAKLDDLGSELGRTYEISIASPAGLDKIANFNLAGLAPSVDFFNVMTYDFHGTWEDTTGHQAAFTGDPAGYDIETAVEAYLNAGVAPEQIVLGAPLYTRAWSGVADGGDGGYNEASSGAAPGTFEAGNYDYKDLLSQINAGVGWELYWDDNAQASYVYNAEQDIFSSFETTTSIALKAEWADAMGLGGMMFWDLSNDATNSPDSLISAAFRSMVLEEDLADIAADSDLPDPIVVGGDGQIGPLPL